MRHLPGLSDPYAHKVNSIMPPTVSIVIPVYNGANYMRQAIDSALAQTYANCEVLVINDGSTDQGKTHDIATSYGNSIRYIEKTNGGVATALNMGIEQMKGEYFAWLSHDDVYLPDKIEKQIQFTQQHGQDVISYTDYDIIDHAGQIVGEYIHDPHTPSKIHHRVRMLMGLPMNGCSLLIHASHFKKVGLFNPHLRYTQDWDMWFRLSKHITYMCLHEKLMQSRIHPNQDSVTQNTIPEEYKLFRNVVEDLTDEELSEYPSPEQAWLTIALRLVRAPRRCSAAPVAYAKYKQLRTGIRFTDMFKVMAYQLGRIIRTRQGYLISNDMK